MTTFNLARLTGIRATLKQGVIVITAQVALNDENMDKARSLRPYLDAEVGGLQLEITPQQTSFYATVKRIGEKAAERAKENDARTD